MNTIEKLEDSMSKEKSSKTILLVEDETLIAMNEASMLKKYGYEVITAISAEKAIEAVRDNSIALILLITRGFPRTITFPSSKSSLTRYPSWVDA